MSFVSKRRVLRSWTLGAVLGAVGIALAAAAPAHSAVLLSEADFAGATAADTYVQGQGTDAYGFYYRSGDGAGPTTGGNPGNYLQFAKYGPSALVAIAAPESLSSISFDRAYATDYTGFRIQIFGLTVGEAVATNSGSDVDATTGERLYESPERLPTSTTFVATDVDLTGVAALQDLSAYDAIVVRFNANFDGDPPRGIDNVVINGEPAVVPEPASAALVLGGLAMYGGLSRRRNRAVPTA